MKHSGYFHVELLKNQQPTNQSEQLWLIYHMRKEEASSSLGLPIWGIHSQMLPILAVAELCEARWQIISHSLEARIA